MPVVCIAVELLPIDTVGNTSNNGVPPMFMRVGHLSNDEVALAGDPPGPLEVVEGMPAGGKMQQLQGVPSAFTPDYAPEEFYEIASKLYKASR